MPAKWKIKEVEELTRLVKESPVVAVANVTGLPSKQMQEIRKGLKGKLDMKVVKNRLAKMAFEKAGIKGIKELEDRIDGPTALIFSQEDPFKLYQKFVDSRVNAPAKPGQIAPMDIVVPAGDTSFKPGPIIADLQGAGIKAKIQGPIIVVMQDSPVIKKGEAFSAQLASVLSQMDINPMEIGINVRAVLENGTVYDAEVLNIDKEATLGKLAVAYQNALNLAVEVCYPTKESVKLMIAKAANNAKNLAIEAEIYNDETVDYFRSKAEREAKGLATAANYTPGEKVESPKEEKKEEVPAEEAAKEISEESKEVKEEVKEEAPSEEAKEDEAVAADIEAKVEEAAEEKLVEEADPIDQVPESPKEEGKSE
jgi:large subunit ribosomal protein L10